MRWFPTSLRAIQVSETAAIRGFDRLATKAAIILHDSPRTRSSFKPASPDSAVALVLQHVFERGKRNRSGPYGPMFAGVQVL